MTLSMLLAAGQPFKADRTKPSSFRRNLVTLLVTLQADKGKTFEVRLDFDRNHGKT